MPKTKISEFSSTPASNTDIDSINIAEGCAPSGINDAIRELMAQLKDFQTGAVGDSFNGPVGTTTAAAGAFTTLAASGAVTLSGGTANGVAYLNGSKVVTSGSALTFNGTSLGIGSSSYGDAGTITASIGVAGTTAGGLQLWASSAQEHFIQWGDSTTGSATYAGAISYNHANDSMRFWTSSLERMILNSTGLGIGTSSPAFKLDVNGIGYFRDLLYVSGSHGISTDSASPLLMKIGGTERMRLDSSGNLGLGVTPSAVSASDRVLQVRNFLIDDNTNGYGIIRYNNYTNGTSDIYLNTGAVSAFQMQGNAFKWYQAASGTAGNAITFTQAMTLNASGQLGIGTTSPTNLLHLAGSSATPSLRLGSTSTGFHWDIGRENATTGDFVFIQTTSGTPTERARIDSSGNLLVGTTTTVATTPGNVISGINGSATNVPFIQCSGAESTSAYSSYVLYSTTASAYRFYVGYNGTISATSTTITAISDVRLKENIRDLDEGLATVMALKPRKFDWKAGKGQDIKNARGFIAQEFETVLPDMIETWRDPAPEGEEPYKAINANLIPTLVKAMQEQQAIIESLKARLDAANL